MLWTGRVVVGSGRSMQAGSIPANAKGIGAKDGVRLPGGHIAAQASASSRGVPEHRRVRWSPARKEAA